MYWNTLFYDRTTSSTTFSILLGALLTEIWYCLQLCGTNCRPVYIYWESVLFPGTIINETTFPNFQINIFYYSSYKITWQVDYIYIGMYVVFKPKKIWENETYFHYLSERLQLLHLCGNPCFQRVEKFYLLFSSRTCLGLRPELHL